MATTTAAAVSYWTEIIGAHIIEYDSVNKKTFHNEWPTEDDLIDRPDIVNHIVTAVDAIKFRKTLDRNRNAEYSPGLTPLFLNGNPQAPEAC
jgi:hypothetical protein